VASLDHSSEDSQDRGRIVGGEIDRVWGVRGYRAGSSLHPQGKAVYSRDPEHFQQLNNVLYVPPPQRQLLEMSHGDRGILEFF
jgi:hypothetical protein